MAAKPSNGDTDWGAKLNAFLNVQHNVDGTHDWMPYIKLVDSKATTTDGGTFTTGAWRKRTVTEETDTDTNCTVAASVIVLAAGTYECFIECPANKVNYHQARLQNTTAVSTVMVGTAAYSSTAHADSNCSKIKGRFTIAASQNLEIQHKCSNTMATSGLGLASSMGEAEIYTVAEFWRVA